MSKGEVAPVDLAETIVDADENIVFNWMDNAGTGNAKGNDKAILVAYFPESKEAAFTFTDITRLGG